MYQRNNSHVGDCTAYSYKVCCSDIESVAIRTECQADEGGILSLYDLTNSHVEVYGYGSYNWHVCGKSISCSVKSSCSAELTVTGKCGPMMFEGSDTITVIDPGKGKGKPEAPGKSGEEHGKSGEEHGKGKGKGHDKNQNEGTEGMNEPNEAGGSEPSEPKGKGKPDTPPGQDDNPHGQGQDKDKGSHGDKGQGKGKK